MHYKSICTINLYGYLFQHLFHKRMVYLEIVPYGIIPLSPASDALSSSTAWNTPPAAVQMGHSWGEIWINTVNVP